MTASIAIRRLIVRSTVIVAIATAIGNRFGQGWNVARHGFVFCISLCLLWCAEWIWRASKRAHGVQKYTLIVQMIAGVGLFLFALSESIRPW